MSRLADLEACFIETFAPDPGTDPTTLRYQSIQAWDSVGHMQLIAAIEARFDIMLDTSDILDLSDFPKAVEIVRKYGADV